MNPLAYKEMADSEGAHWWYVARRKILSSIIKKISLPKNARILEIGSGTGGNLEMLFEYGMVDGMEMDTNAVDHANAKTSNKFKIYNGSFPDDIGMLVSCYDLVCMFDVLEHIDRDEASLACLKNIMKADGKVVITVPAYEWMWSLHDELLHHKRRYVAKKLVEKVKNAGLKVDRLTYYNAILFPLVLIGRGMDKYRGGDKVTGVDTPPMAINKVLEGVFCFERYLLKYFDFPFGVSLMCVLSRSEDKN